MDISLLTTSDIEQILDIEVQSFKRTWDRSIFADEIVRTDASFYGVTCAGCRGDIILAYTYYRCTENHMHLMKLAVAPGWRRKGIASFLMLSCLNKEAGRGISISFLEVRPSNLPAIHFYDKLGFHIVGTRPNYYADSQEDALVMMKQIKEEQ